MADVATLGIAVESTGVDKGAKSLDNLANAAKKAEAATQGVSAATKNAGAAAMSVSSGSTKAAAALNQESAAATKAASALKLHAAAANSNVRGMGAASLNVGNLAAQFQDIGVSAAMAMNPLQIALQQGTQIAAVLGPMGAAGAVRSLGAALLSVVAPVSLLTIGVVALVAAGLQMVSWPGLAAAALNGLASVLQTIAPYAAGAAAALALLYAPAMVGGVVQLIALLGRLATSALGLAAAFAAANPAVAFVLGITAAVAAANIFRDELTEIFGVDIVGAAKDGVNTIIGTFVGGFNGIRAVWSKLPAAIGDFVYSTANAVISGVQSMINAVAGVIDGFIAKINASMQSLPFGMGQSINIGSIGTFDLGQIANPYKNTMKNVGIDVAGAVSAAQGTDYVGNFGTAIAKDASAASAKLKELAGSLTDVDAAAGKAGKAGKKAGDDTAEGFKNAKSAANQAQEAMSFAKDVVGGFFSDFRQGMESGKGVWESFADAASKALDKITEKLLNEMLDAIFQVKGAVGGGGGAGGFLSSLFGGLSGGGTSYFPPAPTLSAGLFANGGTFMNGVSGYSNSVVDRPTMFAFAKGTGLMGEAGPEAIIPLKRDGSGRLGVAVNDNKGSGVEINIINNAGAKVTQQERQTSNGMAIDVMIDEAVAEKINTPGSSSRNAMQGQFRLKGGLARR